MTELDLYLQSIPVIAECISTIIHLPVQQYEERKREILEADISDTAKRFLAKVFMVIDAELERRKVVPDVSKDKSII